MELTVDNIVTEGCADPEIGDRLHISPPYSKSHLAHTFRKLGDPSTRPTGGERSPGGPST